MAGTAAVTMSKIFDAGKKTLQIVCDWTTDATGTASQAIGAALVTALRLSKAQISGSIAQVETIPGIQGNILSSIPNDQYDITLKDAYGYDVADGTLMNRSSGAAETVVFSTPLRVDSELTLAVTNAGSTTQGRLIFTVVPR